MDDDLYIMEIAEAMAERLDSLFTTQSSEIDLFGSLLPSEGAPTRPVWSTLENAYPQAFIDEEESTEYFRKLDKDQLRCEELVAQLPDSSAAAAAPTKQTYREYISSLPPPRPRPVTLKSKPADPVKLAAAQARVLAQQQQEQRHTAAEKEKAAALLAKNKPKANQVPLTSAKQQQQQKTTQRNKSLGKTAPTVALKPTKATTTTTKVVKTTKAAPKKKIIKRVSKIEKLRPKPLTVAEDPKAPIPAIQKQKELLACPPPGTTKNLSTAALMPKTAEKKDEKKTITVANGVKSKDPKTPTIKAMLNEMLTRHKDAVLVTPLETIQIEGLLPNTVRIDTLINKPKTQRQVLPAAAVVARPPPAVAGVNSIKRKEREEDHSDPENKPQDTTNKTSLHKSTLKIQQQQKQQQIRMGKMGQEQRAMASPTKRLKSNHPQTTPAIAVAAPIPSDVSASLDSLSTPFFEVYALLDTVGSAALTLPVSLPSNSDMGGKNGPTATAAAAIEKKLAQARATAHRMSRLSTEKRNSIGNKNGDGTCNDNHVSLMFEMHGGIALLEAAIIMERGTAATTTTPSSASVTAVVSVYDQAAVLLETCSASSATAQGRELTIKVIQVFTQRAAACARLRGALLKMKYHGNNIDTTTNINSGGGGENWKGMHYNKPKKNSAATSMPSSSSSTSSSVLFIEAMKSLESSTEKLNSLHQLAVEEIKNNTAASRAVVALRLMAGEVMNSQPARLWALIDACKASILKIY